MGALFLEAWSGGCGDGVEEPHAFLQTQASALLLLESCLQRAGLVAGALGWALCQAHLVVALLLGLCVRPLSGHLPCLWALLLLYRPVLWDCHGI